MASVSDAARTAVVVQPAFLRIQAVWCGDGLTARWSVHRYRGATRPAQARGDAQLVTLGVTANTNRQTQRRALTSLRERTVALVLATESEDALSISKNELDEMNDLLSKGKTIADISKKYPQYDYWEIYWQVNSRSFLGKKRTITNRLKSLVSEKNKADREAIADEAQALLDEMYQQLKANSAKLIEINRVLREK